MCVRERVGGRGARTGTRRHVRKKRKKIYIYKLVAFPLNLAFYVPSRKSCVVLENIESDSLRKNGDIWKIDRCWAMTCACTLYSCGGPGVWVAFLAAIRLYVVGVPSIVLKTHAIQSVGHPRQLVLVPCTKRLLFVRDAHAPLAEEMGAHIKSLMNSTGHLIGYEAWPCLQPAVSSYDIRCTPQCAE